MTENISCEIIQDLLPNYIEGILSSESEKLVSEHLNKCVYCKKQWENMNIFIQMKPMEKRKIDYLKGIHKKYVNILLICNLLNAITLFICLVCIEKDTDETLFTLFLLFFVPMIMLIKFGLPLFFAVVGFWWYKKINKKWVLVISFICISLFFNSIFSVVKNILIYGP